MSRWLSCPLAMVVLATGASCGRDHVVPGRPVLSTGQELAEIVAASPSGLVAVVSPEECLTCDRSLRAIVGMQRDTVAAVPLVFNRHPTEFERRRMILEGLPHDAAVLDEGLPGMGDQPLLAYSGEGGLRALPLEGRKGEELLSAAVHRAASAVHSSTRGR